MEKANKQLSSINQLTPHCDNCVLENRDNSYSCSYFLNELRTEDFNRIVTLNGGAKACENWSSSPGTKNKFSSAADLQNQLASMFPEVGDSSHNQVKNCTNDKTELDSTKRYKIAKFYHYIKRFNLAASRAYEELSAINNLLGENDELSCLGKGTLDEAHTRCQELKKCPVSKKGALAEIAEKSKLDEQSYLQIKKEIQNLDKTCLASKEEYDSLKSSLSERKPEVEKCQYGVGTRDHAKICRTYTYKEYQKISQCDSAKTNLGFVLHIIEESNPWFKSDNYFNLRKNFDVQSSIKKQMLMNRQELKKKIIEFRDASFCMNGFLRAGQCDNKKIRGLLAISPEIEKSENKSSKYLSTFTYLNTQSCVEEKMSFNRRTVPLLQGAAIDVGLILIGGGVASIAAKGVRAISFEKKAADAISLGRKTAAVLGANLAVASPVYFDALKTCFRPNTRKFDFNTSAKNSCLDSLSNPSLAQDEQKNCVTALAWAGVATLPLVPLLPQSKKLIAAMAAMEKESGRIFLATYGKIKDLKVAGYIRNSVNFTPAEAAALRTEAEKIFASTTLSDAKKIQTVSSLYFRARNKHLSTEELKKVEEALANVRNDADYSYAQAERIFIEKGIDPLSVKYHNTLAHEAEHVIQHLSEKNRSAFLDIVESIIKRKNLSLEPPGSQLYRRELEAIGAQYDMLKLFPEEMIRKEAKEIREKLTTIRDNQGRDIRANFNSSILLSSLTMSRDEYIKAMRNHQGYNGYSAASIDARLFRQVGPVLGGIALIEAFRYLTDSETE
ncbi:MAG: hypothetical protein V4596_09515 [Bdellovibrionota bacterium]